MLIDLKKDVEKFLEEAGYVICEYRGCFDIAAKKDKLLLIKVLSNIDSFLPEQAKNLKIISTNLSANPMIVGQTMTREKLKEGIVYERFDVPTVSIGTFENLICNRIFPRMYRDRGGLYVEVDSDVLKERRQRKNLTQMELAEMVGINKKVIYEHEKKSLRMLLDIADKLEGILNKRIIKSAEPFKRFEEHGEPKSNMEKSVGSDLKKLGFEVDYVKQTPCDVLAKEKSTILSKIEPSKRKLKRSAETLRGFVRVTKRPAILLTTDVKVEDLLGIPVIRMKKLKEIEDKEELLELAKA